MTRATEVSGTRSFTLSRVFDAPRDLVFKVWTDPRYVALWWGVEGASIPRCEMDVRPGGKWRIDMRTPSGTVYPNGGVFVEVVDNERLVYRDVADPQSPAWAGAPPEARVNTVVCTDESGGRTRVTLTVEAGSEADCARLLELGMREGIGQSLDKLTRLLRDIRSKDRA